MGLDGGAHDREEGVDGLAVDRAELDRLFEVAEAEDRPGQVQDDGVARVRDRDPVADPGRPDALAREQHLEQELPVGVRRQGNCRDDRSKDLRAVLAFHSGVHAARLQRARERGGRRGLVRPLDEALRRLDGVGVGPLEQLGLVEAVALVHPVGRQTALLDPTVNRILGHPQPGCRLANAQLHALAFDERADPARVLPTLATRRFVIITPRRPRGQTRIGDTAERRSIVLRSTRDYTR